jgi:hypothetical protein
VENAEAKSSSLPGALVFWNSGLQILSESFIQRTVFASTDGGSDLSDNPKRRIVNDMNISIASGVAGAVTVTVLNEAVRRAAPEIAPRMEILGMRAAKAGFEAAEMEVPPRRQLMPMTFAAEAVSNTAYYSLVGLAKPENAIVTGALLGLAAGIGAVVLPGPMGLGEAPSGRSTETKLMAVAWYLAGGLAAGVVRKMVNGKR